MRRFAPAFEKTGKFLKYIRFFRCLVDLREGIDLLTPDS
jgi:hypothetical protein